MANRVSSNFTDLVQRFASSCLLHPLSSVQETQQENPEEEEEEEEEEQEEEEEEEEERGDGFCYLKIGDQNDQVSKRLERVEGLLQEVFTGVSAMKRAYQSLQEAHSPWDPLKMRVADIAVVEELRRLVGLRERYRRDLPAAPPVVVEGPYSGAAIEELRKEVREKQEMVESLREKLKEQPSLKKKKKKKKKGKVQRKLSCREVAATPSTELFNSCMNQVKAASKAFTTLLLSLMRSANWDIAAAVRSIEPGPATTTSHHSRFAVESYICRKMFHGFENETFYIDGSLTSLIHPEKHRRDCFTQFQDMRSMDPGELLGILPMCHFGKFCAKKFLSIVHPKMEESFFGNVDHRRSLVAGEHPRSQFYAVFLALAKAVWLLHLLAFALEPAPCPFQVSRGAEFHPEYMESVVGFTGDEIPAMSVVGFQVMPGIKIDGFVVKSRVYLVPGTWSCCGAGEKGVL